MTRDHTPADGPHGTEASTGLVVHKKLKTDVKEDI